MLQTAPKSPIRHAIQTLEPNGIALVSGTALHDPDVIALWFGESDLVTPPFIREAAKRRWTTARPSTPMRAASRRCAKRSAPFTAARNAEMALERITVPGAAMLAVVTALQCLIETGDNIVVVSPIWPNIFQAAEMCGRGGAVGAAGRGLDMRRRWRLDLENCSIGLRRAHQGDVHRLARQSHRLDA